MLSDRIQRHIDRLLDEADEAIALRQWEDLRATCETLLSLDPDNSDATLYLALADKSLATDVVSDSSDIVEPSEDPTPESLVDMSLAQRKRRSREISRSKEIGVQRIVERLAKESRLWWWRPKRQRLELIRQAIDPVRVSKLKYI
jgi:hypothetical protein